MSDSSILQPGKPVKGRKPLEKEFQAGSADTLQKKLARKLTDENFGEDVVNLWNKGNSDRSEWLQRQQDFLSQWDEFIDNADVASGPWANASNLHIPITLTAVRTMHARMYAALMGIQPPFALKPLDEAATVAIPLVEGVMTYALREYVNNYNGIEAVVDQWIWNWVATGTGILKNRWDKKFTRFMDAVPTPIPETVLVENPETGQLEPQVKITVQDVEKPVTKKLFDGPIVETLLPEDVLIIGGKGEIQDAESVTHRFYMTRSELYSCADQGIFDADIVDEILEGQEDSGTNDQTGQIKQDRQQNAGIITEHTAADADKFEILEIYCKYDSNDDGLDEDIIAWVHKNSRKVVRATYLHRVFKGGHLPFVKIDFLKRQGQTYGMGIPEIIYPLQRETDAMHNMRMDFGILSTMPFGFYRAASGVNPDKIQLEPGALIPLNDPQNDVFFPNLGNRTFFLEGEEANLLAHIERVISLSDINLGRISGQGAARTATGVSAIVTENNANLDIFIKRMQRGWKQELRIIFQMLQQRLPPEMWIRICGEDGKMYPFRIKKEDIQFNFDFDLDANSVNSNKAITREIAQQVYNLVLNPLLIQMGIVGPENIYEASKNLLCSLDVKDFARFIAKPSNVDAFLTPEQEANRIIKGIPVAIHPAMNHEGFINYVTQIFNNEEWIGSFSQDVAVKLDQQASGHMKMLEALQAQQAQIDQSKQQQVNASTAGAGNASVGPRTPV